MNQNLHSVLKKYDKNKISLKEEERKKNVSRVRETVEKNFIKYMKKSDPLFHEIYQDIYHTGSYYEGLKISEANEFDLNVKLKLPFKAEHIQIVYRKISPGFVHYKLTKSLEEILGRHPKWENSYKKLNNLMVQDAKHSTYLSHEKLTQWFQSVVDRTLHENAKIFQNVKRHCSGPATTLKLVFRNCPDLDVDLVPVVQLTTLPGSATIFLQDCKKALTCFIVPKPPPDHMKEKTVDIWKFFRVSIPDAERQMIKDKGCIKLLVKIFKAIRDREKWKFLPSYYIKTVFLHNLNKSPDWPQEKLTQLFIMMLNEFFRVFNTRRLSHIFFPNYNLLEGIPIDDLRNAKKRLKKMLSLVNMSDKDKVHPQLMAIFS